jgi:hypothetical protein
MTMTSATLKVRCTLAQVADPVLQSGFEVGSVIFCAVREVLEFYIFGYVFANLFI